MNTIFCYSSLYFGGGYEFSLNLLVKYYGNKRFSFLLLLLSLTLLHDQKHACNSLVTIK